VARSTTVETLLRTRAACAISAEMPGATTIVASLVRSEAAGPTTCASVLRAIPCHVPSLATSVAFHRRTARRRSSVRAVASYVTLFVARVARLRFSFTRAVLRDMTLLLAIVALRRSRSWAICSLVAGLPAVVACSSRHVLLFIFGVVCSTTRGFESGKGCKVSHSLCLLGTI